MKKIWNLTLLVMVTSSSSFSQFNLVPNPSFEVFDTCPDFPGQIRFAPPWSNPLIYTTPDYFNACDTTLSHNFNVPDNYAGFQYAHSGVGYALIGTSNYPPNPAAWNAREYMQIELVDSLIAGVDYCIRWYASACDKCNYVSNNMGMYFSPIAIIDTCPGCPMPLPFVPQFENPMTNNLNDSMGWTEISGSYSASGGEKFIIIGNFHDSASTVATYTGWTPGSSFWQSLYYIDDVLITPCDSLTVLNETNNKLGIEVYPNPFDSQLMVIAEKEIIYEATIYSVIGKKLVHETNINSKIRTLQLAHIPVGIYILELSCSKTLYYLKIIKN